MPNSNRVSLISGGHRGAEAEFGRSAKRWGIDQTTLSFEGHAMEWPVGVRVLGEAELAEGDISMEIVSKRMGRTYHQADLIRRVIQSLYHMVNGSWQVAGQFVRPQDIETSALFTIEGELDDISGAGQTHAAHDLCAGIANDRRFRMDVKGAGHYGIFSGRRWREMAYPVVRDFIAKHQG